MATPKRVTDVIVAALKQLQPIIKQQRSRDVSEADTVTLVKDVLSDALGYDKYAELTGEYAIRGTYCDIVIQLAGKPRVVVECKAIGVSLDDKHVKQAVDYAANEGVEWVILTNAVNWRLYGVVFGKPIDKILLADIDLLQTSLKKQDDVDALYVFTKHALEKGRLADTLSRTKAMSRHMIAALLIHNDRLLNTLRRELKRTAGVNVPTDELAGLLQTDVIKRDALDGHEAVQAAQKVNSLEDQKMRRKSRSKADADANESESDSE